MIRMIKKVKSQIQDMWDTIKYSTLLLYTILWVALMDGAYQYEWNGVIEVMLQIYLLVGYMMFISMNWIHNSFEKIAK